MCLLLSSNKKYFACVFLLCHEISQQTVHFFLINENSESRCFILLVLLIRMFFLRQRKFSIIVRVFFSLNTKSLKTLSIISLIWRQWRLSQRIISLSQGFLFSVQTKKVIFFLNHVYLHIFILKLKTWHVMRGFQK